MSQAVCQAIAAWAGATAVTSSTSAVATVRVALAADSTFACHLQLPSSQRTAGTASASIGVVYAWPMSLFAPVPDPGVPAMVSFQQPALGQLLMADPVAQALWWREAVLARSVQHEHHAADLMPQRGSLVDTVMEQRCPVVRAHMEGHNAPMWPVMARPLFDSG